LTKIPVNDQQQCLTPLGNAAIIPALLDFEVKERKISLQIVCLQTMVTLAFAFVAYSMNSTPQFALAVLSGGGVSVANGTLLAWRMSRSASNSTTEANQSHSVNHQLRLLYFFAAERFLVVVALLGLCMAVLKLLPLALLAGFMMGQTVLLAARLLFVNYKTKDRD
jgi:ATP synthase protein I